jgi:6-pyruvoyltetrahydropterin/6-carboxytetrahydropterin synthase
MYRICKSFEVETGHILSKHQEKCKNPHGHTRQIMVYLTASELDDNDMVCDFKILKLGIGDFIDSFDHAILVNTNSPHCEYFKKHFERVIEVDGVDPTTEVIAKMVYERMYAELKAGKTYVTQSGATYNFTSHVKLDKIRVVETPTSWAEYWADV